MSNKQSKLNDFGDELVRIQADSQLLWASVDRATPTRRENHYSDVEPGDDGYDDEGLQIRFKTASGRPVETWLEKPCSWDIVTSDLVLLLEYWGLSPGEIERLNDEDETWEVPMTTVGSEGYRPDWQEIERTIQTRNLEERDDDGD